jgi:two-component system sensor histidine kinase KdpD
MNGVRGVVRDGLYTLAVLALAFAANVLMYELLDSYSLIPMVFIVGVFFVALKTRGYAWGIIASLSVVIVVNYVFTYPYYAFDFKLWENLVSAAAMLAAAVVTSTLTTKIRRQERVWADGEREKMRANLLRAISHDLRTPLTSIYGGVSAIIENYDSLKKQQQLKLLGDMRDDAEWLIRMVENVLSVTRIGGEEVQVIKTPTVLEELIDAALTKFHKRYPDRRVLVKIPDEFISIPMDALLIEQVIINMLENAVFHARGMTELSLEVSVSGRNAVFTIADNGCGIPRDRLGGIFAGYTDRADVRDGGRQSSMGIGLSVCAAIIRAHGGAIQAENRPGGGALLRFSLEMEAADYEQ